MMDRCPLEILDYIVARIVTQHNPGNIWDWSNLDFEAVPVYIPLRLSQYSSISRGFQHAVERRTFKSICVKSSEFPLLTSMLAGNRNRILYIKILSFDIEMPIIKEQKLLHILQEWDHNDQTFTQLMKSLFSTINSWNTQNIELQLSFTIPSLESSWMNNELTILDSNLIPESRAISALHIGSYKTIHFGSAFLLATKCPNLRILNYELNESEKWFPHIQKSHRYHLSKSLYSIPLALLQQLDLIWHQNRPPGTSILLNDNIDHLSESLRILSLAPNLRDLSIKGCALSPSIFWDNDSNKSYWPKLESYCVSTTVVTPDGDILVKNTDGSDPYTYQSSIVPGFGLADELSIDLNRKAIITEWAKDDTLISQGIEFLNSNSRSTRTGGYRLLLNGRLFEDYIFSMVKAKKNMPKIRYFLFEINHGGPPFSVLYDSSEAGYSINNTTRDPWRPSSSLMAALNSSLKESESVSIHVSDSA
jgi:hypothetical protein